ncbi:MAG: glutamate--tRNA ligase [Candidatus Hodarchaeota archaeon]
MVQDDSLEEIVYKFVLENAVRHDGKADVGAVMKKIMASSEEYRKRSKEVIKVVRKIVSEVNVMSPEDQEAELELVAPELVKVEKEKREVSEVELPELPKVEMGKVVMRLAPFPSGPLHIGNARMVILNDEYVKRYKGKLLLVYDDTIGGGKTGKRILPEAYDVIKDELEWLGIKIHETYYKSDRLPLFCNYTEELIKKGHAYVCTCEAETFREKFKSKGISCPCRTLTIEENLKRWSKMIEGAYKEGEAAVRLKTGMDHPNPAVRDHVIMRICDAEHPRVGKKYRVWPLLDFSWAIDDHLLGMTHILRGKDLVKEDIIEKFVWKFLEWPEKIFVHYGRLKISGLTLSKTVARKKIEEGEYFGWEDPRTWSLKSLDARGIKPDALRNAIKDLGLSLVDIEFSPEAIYAHNRKIIDPAANRYFFVENPVELKVFRIPYKKLTPHLPKHPDFTERGNRMFEIKILDEEWSGFITLRDAEKNEGEIIRLKGLMNINLNILKNGKISAEYHSRDVEAIKEKNVSIIHWVPEEEAVNAKVLMPDGEMIEGFAEPSCKELKVGEIIQFERFGFGKIKKILPQLEVWFAHK